MRLGPLPGKSGWPGTKVATENTEATERQSPESRTKDEDEHEDDGAFPENPAHFDFPKDLAKKSGTRSGTTGTTGTKPDFNTEDTENTEVTEKRGAKNRLRAVS